MTSQAKSMSSQAQNISSLSQTAWKSPILKQGGTIALKKSQVCKKGKLFDTNKDLIF